MGFSRQEYWSRLPCLPPGNLPHPGFEPESLILPALVGGFFNTSSTISLQCRRSGFNSWVGKIPWRRTRQPTNRFLPRNPQGQRSLAGYSQQGCKKSATTDGCSRLIQAQERQLLNFQEFCKPIIKHRHYQKLSYANSQWNKPYWKTLNSLIPILWYFTLQDIYMYCIYLMENSNVEILYNSVFSDVMLIVWNWPWWKYLYYRNATNQ